MSGGFKFVASRMATTLQAKRAESFLESRGFTAHDVEPPTAGPVPASEPGRAELPDPASQIGGHSFAETAAPPGQGDRDPEGTEASVVADEAPTSHALQRLVLPLSQDDMTARSYKHLTEPSGGDSTGSLRPIDQSLPGLPLSQLGADEALHVIVHGMGAGETVEGDAGGLLECLKSQGFDPAVHKGTIRLIVCWSGAKDAGGKTLAGNLAALLRAEKADNAVIGFDGLVQVRTGASVFVVGPKDEARFFELSAKTRKYKALYNLLQEKKGELTQDQELLKLEEELSMLGEQEVLEQELDLLEREVDLDKKFKVLAKRFKEISDEQATLWKPQSLDANIVYIAKGEDPYPDSN